MSGLNETEEVFSITVVLTEREIKALRQAVMAYAWERYHARQDRMAAGLPGSHRAGWMERAAEAVERKVLRASECQFPMGKVEASDEDHRPCQPAHHPE